MMLTAIVLLACVSSMAIAQSGDTSNQTVAQRTASTPVTVKDIAVWPHMPPGETVTGENTSTGPADDSWVTAVLRPTLHYFTSTTKSTTPRACILVFPGGSYTGLAETKEGTDVAKWLVSLGYDAAVLEYRVPQKPVGALQDAQRSVSMLRSRASEFNIDPQHIGVLGFSAGGSLATRTATGSAHRSYEPIDKLDKASCRPDFAVLIYPAYLLGSEGQPNPEVRPDGNTPPIFLAQTQDDYYLDAPGYAKALDAAHVPYKLVMYDKGGHGYGLRADPSQPNSHWPDEAATWLAGVAPVSK